MTWEAADDNTSSPQREEKNKNKIKKAEIKSLIQLGKSPKMTADLSLCDTFKQKQRKSDYILFLGDDIPFPPSKHQHCVVKDKGLMALLHCGII